MLQVRTVTKAKVGSFGLELQGRARFQALTEDNEVHAGGTTAGSGFLLASGPRRSRHAGQMPLLVSSLAIS